MMLVKLTIDGLDIIGSSITFMYLCTLILKHTKIKLKISILLILLLAVFGVVSMILNGGNVARLTNNTLLIILMGIYHVHFYYKEYKSSIDLGSKYNLEEWHIKAIDLIIKDNPTVSEMTEEMNQSISTVNSYLKTIYDKMGIPEGGNRKAGLILKLAQLGYISH